MVSGASNVEEVEPSPTTEEALDRCPQCEERNHPLWLFNGAECWSCGWGLSPEALQKFSQPFVQAEVEHEERQQTKMVTKTKEAKSTKQRSVGAGQRACPGWQSTGDGTIHCGSPIPEGHGLCPSCYKQHNMRVFGSEKAPAERRSEVIKFNRWAKANNSFMADFDEVVASSAGSERLATTVERLLKEADIRRYDGDQAPKQFRKPTVRLEQNDDGSVYVQVWPNGPEAVEDITAKVRSVLEEAGYTLTDASLPGELIVEPLGAAVS